MQSSLAFGTRSERIKLEALTALHGVSIPMASAILTLTNPRRYGVIDIRVWQLLFDLKSVRTKPRGVGFNFNNWYHYLMKLRYHASELKSYSALRRVFAVSLSPKDSNRTPLQVTNQSTWEDEKTRKYPSMI